MDGGAWWATVHRVAKSWTRLSGFTFTFTEVSKRPKLQLLSCRARRQTQVTLGDVALFSSRPLPISWIKSLSFLWFLKNSSLLFRQLFAPLMICLAVLKMGLEDCFRGVYDIRIIFITTLTLLAIFTHLPLPHTQVHRGVSRGCTACDITAGGTREQLWEQLPSTKPDNREVCENQTIPFPSLISSKLIFHKDKK